jgi:hypothetical protein
MEVIVLPAASMPEMKCRVPSCMANSEADKRGAEDKPKSSKRYDIGAQGSNHVAIYVPSSTRIVAWLDCLSDDRILGSH